MSYAVLKGTSYTLAFTPSMVLHNGTTQTTEMIVNPESEYLKELPSHLRSYEEVVNYLPNQVYIGNQTDDALRNTAFPWYDKPVEGTREGKFGEIMPEDEFVALMQICDVFDLVVLEEGFAAAVKAKIEDLLPSVKAEIEDFLPLIALATHIPAAPNTPRAVSAPTSFLLPSFFISGGVVVPFS